MYHGLEQRRCISLALTLFLIFFFCASYWLWSGAEHVRLVPSSSFHSGDDAAPAAASGVGGVEVEIQTKPAAPAPTETETDTLKSPSLEIRPDEIVLAEYDESAIRDLCKNSSWADSRNVVVNCESRVGGVGMLPQSTTPIKAPN
ncbi:hypothetical protein V492_03823 [Pseudogymnoascus sp. VKM F-4246]|nr:hypothetical protein V492_03823 [Pseudogymnoascus sp. VKM F-4246]